jgi:hypothetical protein
VTGRQHREGISADFIGDVTVSCHPIGAYHHARYGSRAQYHSRHIIRNYRYRNAFFVHFPSRQSCALQEGSGFIGKDLDLFTLISSCSDNT